MSSQSAPLCAVTTPSWVGSSTSVRSLEKPFLARACAPSLPASSPISARKDQRMFDFTRAGLCAHSRTAQSAAAIGPLVSVEPRPKSFPSRMTGSKGAIVMPATLTVSRCGAKARWAQGEFFGANVATTLGRPGSTGSRATSASSARRKSATYPASACSPTRSVPGLPWGFTLGIATRS